MPRYSLGIDIGGTFTDLVVYDHGRGRQVNRKVLTTHDDPSRAVAAGVAGLLGEGGVDPAHLGRVVHATTLFTNALIERKGAVTGLITTAGFADTLEVGRERKYELYDINTARPAPLVPRHLRLEVPERVRADGSVRETLDAKVLASRAEDLVRAGVASVAIVFLHAYANPRHEAEAARLVAARFPDLHVTTSHEVAPEIREFERASTTVANAFIKPLAHRYLALMAGRLAEQRIPAPLLLMLSSGGLTHVAEAQRTPVQMLESGPAAGAIAAAFFGNDDSGGKLVAFDMGGTTAKLSLVDAGEPLTAYSFEAARQRRFVEGSGFPIRISTIELIEIGAGGGSIAHVDEIGLLKVGPQSAGSQPGPAAYGLGGTEATVTDADFILGYLNPEYFAGGTMRIHLEAAQAALGRVAERAGLSPVEVAWGIHDIVNENMAGAARVHIAERGRDPREYALLCTGGAGPVHAHSVARKIGLRRVICPPSAGVASALGLLVAPARVDRVATVGIRLDRDDCAELEAAFRRLEGETGAILADSGVELRRRPFSGWPTDASSARLTLVALPPAPRWPGREGGDRRCARRSRRPIARSLPHPAQRPGAHNARGGARRYPAARFLPTAAPRRWWWRSREAPCILPRGRRVRGDDGVRRGAFAMGRSSSALPWSRRTASILVVGPGALVRVALTGT